MIRRAFCIVLAVLLLSGVLPAAAASNPLVHSYDFDFTFSLYPESFPVLLRSKMTGYADLVNRLGLRGNITINSKVDSFDMDAVLYYTDNESLSYPFRLFGAKSRLFFQSPVINNKKIFLDMRALMPFAAKAKNTLNLPLTYLAILYPYSTEYAFSGLTDAWEKEIGSFTKSGKVSVDQLSRVSDRWVDEYANNPHVQRWITTLMDISSAPSLIESEFENLFRYHEIVTGGRPLSVTVKNGSETWRDASGNTLFSRVESNGSLSVELNLPASENGYLPRFSLTEYSGGQTSSFDLKASLSRESSAGTGSSDTGSSSQAYPDPDNGEWGEYDPYTDDGGWEDYGPYTDDGWESVESILSFHAKGSGFPRDLPADSSFSLSASLVGAAYPNYAFLLQGTTDKNGAAALSLCKPGSAKAAPVEILRCSGTLLPSAEAKKVPNYQKRGRKNSINVFSFNEQSLSAFTKDVIPCLVRSLLSFVEAAPTSACQSILDDLTDLGVLDMLLQ